MSLNGSHEESIYEKPVPRGPKSPARQAQIQVRNRRQEYLNSHPAYFDNVEHELANPVLYERLVKRFQSAEERAREAKDKGYGRTLEADLLRGETRLAEMDPSEPQDSNNNSADTAARTGPGVDESWEQPASTKEEGLGLWREYLAERFVRGGDGDFDYGGVDGNDEYDELARRDAEDAWFDDEEPS